MLFRSWFGTLSGVEIQVSVGAISTVQDPPSGTASWGAEDNLWIATLGGAQSGSQTNDISVSAYPSGYTNTADALSNESTVWDAVTGGANLENASATENPGAFTVTTSVQGEANNVVIRPASGRGFPASLFPFAQSQSTLLRM